MQCNTSYSMCILWQIVEFVRFERYSTGCHFKYCFETASYRLDYGTRCRALPDTNRHDSSDTRHVTAAMAALDTNQTTTEDTDIRY